MALLELPHTAGCVVCGLSNPHGLHLHLSVDTKTGAIHTHFTPSLNHAGFEGIVHGGLLATILDEAMVWAATWTIKRFCVSGEMNVRYRKSATIGTPLTIEAKVDASRSRLIETLGQVRDPAGDTIAEATGKYIPVPPERNDQFMHTLLDQSETNSAFKYLTQR